MRTATPYEVAYAWHTNALKGVYGTASAMHPDDPQCGYFKRKMVGGGVFVPARIWLVAETDIGTGELLDDEIFQCEVDGQRADPVEQWSYLAANPISEQEFQYMTALRNHAVRHEPDHPMADPRKAVNWLRVPLPTFNRSEP